MELGEARLAVNKKHVITSYSIHYTKLYEPHSAMRPSWLICWMPLIRGLMEVMLRLCLELCCLDWNMKLFLGWITCPTGWAAWMRGILIYGSEQEGNFLCLWNGDDFVITSYSIHYTKLYESFSMFMSTNFFCQFSGNMAETVRNNFV